MPPSFNLAAASLEPGLGPLATRTAIQIVDAGGVQDSLSFGELRERALGIAGALAEMGIEPGDRVMLWIPSGLDYAACALGVLSVGAVLVPSTTLLVAHEAAFIATDSQAALVIVESREAAAGFGEHYTVPVAELRNEARRFPRPRSVRAEDPALLIYTSGSSATPKGVLHAHRMAQGRELMREGWTGIGPNDVVLHAGALNWTYAFGISLIDTLSVGATTTLYDGPRDPALWPRLIEQSGATIFAAVPTIYRQILKYAPDEGARVASLRHALCAGEPLPAPLYHAWKSWAGCELYEALGMTECSTYISAGPVTPPRPGSPGKPQPGRRVAILPVEGGEIPLPAREIGLIAVHHSDPGLMLRYWNRPDEAASVFRGEWFIGGDLGALDDDGYLWFHGRSDAVLNALGYRVSPLEIETVVSQIPGVVECAASAWEVREGLSIIALHVVREGQEPEREAILAWCNERLAEYKRPREIFFVDALPRGRNSKVDRKALARSLQEG